MLSIPFFRHKLSENTVRNVAKAEENKMICNKAFACMILPKLVEEVNVGKLPMMLFAEKKYIGKVMTTAFGKKANDYMADFKIERVSMKSKSDLSMWLYHTPSNNAIGQTLMVCAIKDDKGEMHSYTLEHSIGGKFMVCEWRDKMHSNYGSVEAGKNKFVEMVVELTFPKHNDSSNLSRLDLKHRLADEIGVRVEKLDFYMNTFQKMVYDEMTGVDTSGIPYGVDDVEEWERYCQWEIKQASQRMSSQDMDFSKRIYRDWLINRDRSKLN